jgi:hypothetical protein
MVMNAESLTICHQCKKLFPFHETRGGTCFACYDEMTRPNDAWKDAKTCIACQREKPATHITRSGRCFPCDLLHDPDRGTKPPCPLVDTDGNVFAIIGRVRRCLEHDDQPDRAREFVERATSAKSYDDVLQLTFEYVDPM